MRRTASFVVLAALVGAALVAGLVEAQPGVGFSKTAPLSGTGSSGSPLKITVCGAGSSYVSDGSAWQCTAAAAGDITGVTAGSGLTGGATSGNATLDVGAGSGILISADAIAVDATYIATIGDITGVTAGNGLTGGGTSGAISLDVACGTGLSCNANDVTLNIGGTCTGQFVSAVSSVGAVTCTSETGDIAGVSTSGILTGGCTSGTCSLDTSITGPTILGRTSGTGATSQLTGTQATALLDTFSTSSTTKGLVTGSNSGGASVFLNGNGGWTTPAGTGPTGSGTTGTVAKWTSSTALGNSIITENLSTITVSGALQTTSNISSGSYLNATTSIYSGNGGATSAILTGNGLTCAYNTNATATCTLGAVGYQEGTTQFRNWNFQDGKGADMVQVEASTKHMNYYGSAPTLSSCTGVCTMASYSTDQRGRMDCTDGAAATCTVTFAVAYTTNPPVCHVQLEKSTSDTDAVTITAISTSAFSFLEITTGAHSYSYQCDGML